MDKPIALSKLKVYTISGGKSTRAAVQYTALSFEQAKAQGWHFRRKSNSRIRITGYTGDNDDVTVPSEIGGFTVNELGSRAFADRKVIQVAVPDTVKKLRAGCFSGSTVECVVFAEGLIMLPERVFANCEMLKHVHLPCTLQQIGEYAFGGCKALESIVVPGSCYRIKSEAFAYSGLRELSARLWSKAVSGDILIGTPLAGEYDLITLNAFDNNMYILLIDPHDGNRKIEFPKGRIIEFCKNSVSVRPAIELDMRACTDVRIYMDSFLCQPYRMYGEAVIKVPHDAHSSPYDLPGWVATNRYLDNLYRAWKTTAYELKVSLRPAVVSEHAVNSYYVREVYFETVRTVSERPVEIFGDRCRELYKVSWEEDGVRYTRYTTPVGLIGEAYREMLKAFVLSNKPEKGSVFYDRSVADRLFLGCTEYKLTRAQRTAVAADVLRSTPKPNEGSLDIYTRFLDKNRAFIMRIKDRLPQEYKDFLQSYFSR